MLEIFTLYPNYFLFAVFIISLTIGSFLNVVIYRLPIMMENEWKEATTGIKGDKFTLSFPDSSCPSCKYKIRWFENIPLFSYLLLKGKCSSCKVNISKRYPLVELLTATISTLVAFKFGFNFECIALIVFSWVLIALAFIDYDHQLLPDDLTLALMWIGIVVNLNNTIIPLKESILGSIFGYLSLWIIFWIFKIVTKKDGIGYGDFKLFAALGAWFGWQNLPNIVTISALSAVAVYFIFRIINTKNCKNDKLESIKFPFGPALTVGAFSHLFLFL